MQRLLCFSDDDQLNTVRDACCLQEKEIGHRISIGHQGTIFLPRLGNAGFGTRVELQRLRLCGKHLLERTTEEQGHRDACRGLQEPHDLAAHVESVEWNSEAADVGTAVLFMSHCFGERNDE